MKKLIFSVLAVAAMASCSKSELVERPADAVIMAKTEVLTVKQGITKTPFEGITTTESLTARVIASTTSGDFDPTGASLYHDANMVFVDGSDTKPVGYNPSKAYPTDGSSVFLCGLYPASTTDWTNFSTSNSGGVSKTTAEYVFDGKTDVMIAAQVETKKSEALANPAVFKTLNFNHMLTKLVVRAKAASADAIDDFGGVTEITLTKANGSQPNTTILATLNDGTADASKPANFTTPTASFAFYTVDAGVATDNAFTAQNVALIEVDGTVVTEAPTIAYSIVAPIIADGTEDYELLVKTEKNTKGFTVPVNLKAPGGSAFTGTTQGKYFIITLEFESTPIQTQGKVTAWVEGGSDDITIK